MIFIELLFDFPYIFKIGEIIPATVMTLILNFEIYLYLKHSELAITNLLFQQQSKTKKKIATVLSHSNTFSKHMGSNATP